MPKDFGREAIQESEAREASRRWVQARIEAIRKNVSAHDVLRRNGITLRYSEDREEQFSCPFHGIDKMPSARVYPETVRGPSHVWCFVCHENWDSIKLWQKFGGGETKFTRVLAEMERAFGITPPERPPTPAEMADYVDPEVTEVEMLFAVCERHLRHSKAAFEPKAHFTVGSILDRLRYQFDNGAISVEKAKGVIQQVLDKIRSRERER